MFDARLEEAISNRPDRSRRPVGRALDGAPRACIVPVFVPIPDRLRFHDRARQRLTARTDDVAANDAVGIVGRRTVREFDGGRPGERIDLRDEDRRISLADNQQAEPQLGVDVGNRKGASGVGHGPLAAVA